MIMEFNFNTLNSWFWLCAVAGTVVYSLRYFMAFMGADTDLDFDSDAIGHGDADSSFGVFSLTSLTGFAMFFGWGGLTAANQFELNASTSLIFAFVCGLASIIVTIAMGKLMLNLISEGDAFSLDKTVGKTAEVYLKIAGEAGGKIQVSVNDFLHEVDAVADSEISSGTVVKVVKVLSSNLVKVEKV